MALKSGSGTEKENSRYYFMMIAIVAIIAIVALVMMVNGKKSDIAMTDDDLTGNAVGLQQRQVYLADEVDYSSSSYSSYSKMDPEEFRLLLEHSLMVDDFDKVNDMVSYGLEKGMLAKGSPVVEGDNLRLISPNILSGESGDGSVGNKYCGRLCINGGCGWTYIGNQWVCSGGCMSGESCFTYWWIW